MVKYVIAGEKPDTLKFELINEDGIIGLHVPGFKDGHQGGFLFFLHESGKLTRCRSVNPLIPLPINDAWYGSLIFES